MLIYYNLFGYRLLIQNKHGGSQKSIVRILYIALLLSRMSLEAIRKVPAGARCQSREELRGLGLLVARSLARLHSGNGSSFIED